MEMLLNGLLAYSQVARTPDSPPQSVDVGEVIESVQKNLSQPFRRQERKSPHPSCRWFRESQFL